MSLVGFKAQNHRQQVKRRGANPRVDNLETPWDVFTPWQERFGFTLDVAALPHDAKCDRYFTPEDNGLMQSWAGHRVWCNPPYSDLESWVEKANGEWLLSHRSNFVDGPELIVMLVPANRCEQGWWQRQVEPYRDDHGDLRRQNIRTEFISGRIRFIRHDAEKVEPNDRPPFGCCLLIWGQG